MKGESTRDIIHLESCIFLPLWLLFKDDKMELQFLLNIRLLLAIKISYIGFA